MPRSPANQRADTADEEFARALRRMSPAECIALVCEANETARLLSAAGVRYLHPEWTEIEVQAEVARRMLGDSA